jgi:DNA-binding NarL/FixJ family response regulator
MLLPDGEGVELCRELSSRMPELRCLMLTSFPTKGRSCRHHGPCQPDTS